MFNLFPILFLLFFLIPLIEIYLLVQVGSAIGAFWTIFFVVLTAVIGAFLIRRQGFSTFARFQGKMQTGEIPAREMFDGFCLLLAGAFLMTPGFFTDSIGFILLIPPIRSLFYQKLGTRIQVVQTGGFSSSNAHHSRDGQAPIEGEYSKTED